jgi:uncharacterized protein with NRDE domain
MCLILLAVAASPEYPLVIAANRDEFFARETSPAGFWPGTELLAGQDRLQGGSWFGLTRQGRLAMVTNVRTPRAETSSLSRGHLVRDYLLSAATPEAFLDRVIEPADKYPGFNLILGDIDALYFASNRSQTQGRLAAGIHGLSNASLDTPWPKVARGRQALKDCLESADDRLIERLFDLLNDRQVAADAELPETGVSREWERVLSARFIQSADYGTRSSTLLLVDRSRQALFIERSFASGGDCCNEQRFALQL